MLEIEETIREAEEASIIRRLYNSGRVDDPMENDEVLEEIPRYAPKEEVTFVNGVLGGNQGQDNVGKNVKGSEIGAHLGSEIENKEEIITLNSEM